MGSLSSLLRPEVTWKLVNSLHNWNIPRVGRSATIELASPPQPSLSVPSHFAVKIAIFLFGALSISG